MRINDISLLEVVSRYLKIDTFEREGKSNRYKIVCPFHKDSAPSLTLYDNTAKGKGWDYHCYVCGAHGTAPTMLTVLGLAASEEAAHDMLRKDFDMELPEDVTLKVLAEFKGISADFAKDNGWADSPLGVEIPFYDIQGDVVSTKIRTKYVGKDKYIYKKASDTVEVSTIPYGLHWLDAYESDILYLTEGETDCITLRQSGLQAIGIAGTNGYKPAYAGYFDRFTSIVVVHDNDDAGWRLITDLAESFEDKLFLIELPKGVKDINNFHQYRCNSDIEVFQKMFATLPLLPATPKVFMEQVKLGAVLPTETICWDMVGRFMHTKADLLYYKDIFAKETKTSKTVINACINAVTSKKVHNSVMDDEDKDFIIDNNCYHKLTFRGDKLVQERISNFIITPVYDINSDGEIIRVVDLINAYGKVARKVHLDAETLSSSNKFNQRCISAGDYIFTGTLEDLFQLCMMIFNTPKRVVHSPRRIGRTENGGWLFGNCGIDSTGEVVPLEDNLVILDDVAYTPRSISIDDGSGDTGNSTDLPTFDIEKCEIPQGALGEIARNLRSSFGNISMWLALGWCVAGWFSDEIFEKYGYYPYLFLTGKRASGKSVACTMLQSTYGFASSNAGMSIETPSNVGIMRYLQYRSSMPQWYDDYRNDVKRITMKDGLLLDVYNRHGSVKGTRDGNGSVRQEQVNGFLLLSGEDTPANNALLTRCVTITLSAYDREPSYLAATQDGMESLHNYALQWAAKSTRGETTELFASIAACNAEILARCGDARYAGNAGIFLGAFLWAFGAELTDREIRELKAEVYRNSEVITAEQNAEHPMAQFFNDFPNMIASGLISKNNDYVLLQEPDRIAIHIPSCYKAWQDYNKGAPLSKKSLRGYLEKEAFFVTEERARLDVLGRQRCMIFRKDSMAKEFDDFVESVWQNNEFTSTDF